MGVHYVHDIDDKVDAMDPEAMVYEVVDPSHQRLVAVEYIVPAKFVDDASVKVVVHPNPSSSRRRWLPTAPSSSCHDARSMSPRSRGLPDRR